MHPSGSCKCLHCGELFRPDARNRARQRYCGKAPCRKARKAASQQAWLSKPGNADYFKGEHNAARVQAWRKAHPGHWKRSPRRRRAALQDRLITQPPAAQEEAASDASQALQDDWKSQSPVIVGLIAHLAGTALQDDLAAMTRTLHSRGRAVLGIDVPRPVYAKTPDRSRPPSARAAAV